MADNHQEQSMLLLLQKKAWEKADFAGDMVENLLRKRVLYTRFQLTQNCLLRKEGEWAKDQMSHLDLDADIEKHSQAIKNFQAIREFYSGIGELSFTEDKMLMLWASTTVATSELEKQADVNNDDSLREFVQVTRARLAEEEKLFFDNPFLSAIGNRSSGVVNVQKFANRLALGIFGGLSLLVPMLIMVLYPTTITHLVTTIVSVMLVAISLSLAMGKSGSKDIFTAVAAYTAVLVVFVGTSNNMDEEISTFTVTDIVATSVLGGIVAMLAAWFGVAHIFFAKRTARKQRLADSGFDPIFRFLEPIAS